MATDLLWLSAETPGRDGGGGQRRQYHQIRALCESGVSVVVAALAGPQDDSSVRALTSVHRFPASRRRPGRKNPSLQRLIEVVAPRRALVAHLESVPHVLPVLRRNRVPTLIDFHNVLSRWYVLSGDKRRAVAWRHRERKALAAAARATACSVEEQESLIALATGTPVEVSPHGIDPAEWPAKALAERREQTVAMFGSWKHEPNRLGVEWLAREVWPRVRAAIPAARLLLLGPARPPDSVLDSDGVELVGRVASLAEALGRVRVAVVPIQRGIGARVKFIESLASGAAVVSTAAGCEGFAAEGAFIQADDPEGFADACVNLLSDETWAMQIGSRGRDVAFSRYSWSQAARPILTFARRMDLGSSSDTP